MKNQEIFQFSPTLQTKIEKAMLNQRPVQLGRVRFASPLLLAPMSMICKAPYRRLMEHLGSGGTVSELISCHGILYNNERTLEMLKIDGREKHVGLQLFGEDEAAMAEAALRALDYNQKDQHRLPDFIDINMGCPVRKVVSKGGGSALLKDPGKLSHYLSTIKKALRQHGNDIPLTIKIRTGWDDENRNAAEVVDIAYNEGVEFVAIHGRTRTQQYKGRADWQYIESIAADAKLPIIGNGDLNSSQQIDQRLSQTHCQALMMGRAPLRNPFLFLEQLQSAGEKEKFNGSDYMEVITALTHFILEEYQNKKLQEKSIRAQLVQVRKHIIWFAAGFSGAATFRDRIFKAQDLGQTLDICREFFEQQNERQLDENEVFMTSGHG